MSHDGHGLAGQNSKRNIAQHPIFLLGLAALVRKPHIAKFYFPARIAQRNRSWIAGDSDWFVEQLKYALRSRHGRLQNIKFFTQVLDGPKKPLRELHKCHQDPQSKGTGKNSYSTHPQNQRDGRHTQELHGRVEERKRENGILIREHMIAIALDKLHSRAPLAIKDLHDAHAGNVFLEKSINASNRGSNAPIGLAHKFAEHKSD